MIFILDCFFISTSKKFTNAGNIDQQFLTISLGTKKSMLSVTAFGDNINLVSSLLPHTEIRVELELSGSYNQGRPTNYLNLVRILPR